MPIDSLKKRYVAKLSTNFIGLVISLVTQTIIPRGLGPKAYGDFNYLTRFFSELMPFFSLSTSIGFYTKLSQRQNEFGLISFYFQFTALAFIGIFLFVTLSKICGISSVFWIDQNSRYIYMAVLWVLMTWIVRLLTQIADAFALTVSTEVARIYQKCIALYIIAILFWRNQLDLNSFFYYHFFILILLIFMLSNIIFHNCNVLSEKWLLSRNQINRYIREFYEYSSPLFMYAMIGMVVGILDRWMLQKYAGSVQQGFFGLSYQIGAICFLFTSALRALITREFSIYYAKNEIKKMALLFRRHIPTLYSLSAFLGCFACLQAEKITYIFGGEKFYNASVPVAIMALYPIHQTYGQLNGSVFYAAGQTALYRNIGIVFMIIGIPVTYMMIAPYGKMGLSAGATGLAIKFVAIQFFTVNVQLWFNAKFLNLKFNRYFAHQIISVTCLLIAATITKYFIDHIMEFKSPIFIYLFVSGMIYTFIAIFIVIFMPEIFGVSRKDVNAIYSRIKYLYK